MTKNRDIAEWMVEEMDDHGCLYQETVVYQIKSLFGDEFVYHNQNGNLAISRGVLREFRKLTERDVVWERGERMWRRRMDHDPEGRQVD